MTTGRQKRRIKERKRTGPTNLLLSSVPFQLLCLCFFFFCWKKQTIKQNKNKTLKYYKKNKCVVFVNLAATNQNSKQVQIVLNLLGGIFIQTQQCALQWYFKLFGIIITRAI